jgi:hypothetical protein
VARSSRRTTVAVVAFVLVLLLSGAAYGDNYTYRRTPAGDRAAAAIAVRASDFPARLRLAGGRVRPDETPNTDSCDGYTPKESDLVVAGDAESRFHDSAHSLLVDSQVELFRTAAMAATDVRRGRRMLAPSCQAQEAKQEHVKMVSYSLLGRPRCSCDFAVSVMLEARTPNPNLDLLSVVTAVRKGRVEALVVTSAGKARNVPSGAAALRTALAVQELAVKAVLVRLHAT